ncbi:MAG: hypothetical protein VKJ04_05865 [Vampirovibrionales bacterium]|nr:hypothetical protein [Vampirovibrionales bacterium]
MANTPGELTEFFKAVPPEATLELFAHGNPTAIYATFCESPEEQVITTQTLPSIFKPLKDKRLRCVTLHACEVGARPKQAGQLNFAQTLSDYLQTTVYGSPFLSRGIFGFYGGLYNQYQNGQFKGLRWCW